MESVSKTSHVFKPTERFVQRNFYHDDTFSYEIIITTTTTTKQILKMPYEKRRLKMKISKLVVT
jgi:hypothetical protein